MNLIPIRVYNSKLDRIALMHIKCMGFIQPVLELRTRARLARQSCFVNNNIFVEIIVNNVYEYKATFNLVLEDIMLMYF
jgi:hypothetical protein